MFWSETEFSQRPQKIFQPFTSVDTASSGSYKVYLTIYENLKNSYLKRVFRTIKKGFWLTSIQKLSYMKTTALGLK